MRIEEGGTSHFHAGVIRYFRNALEGVDPVNKALIVLDVQNDFLGNTLDYIAPLCQKYVNEAAKDYKVVITTQWVYPEAEGTSELLVNHLKATVVKKRGYSGFTAETRELFEQAGIEEVHIAGVDSEGAVLATMFACLDAGYKVQILERLVTSYHGRNWESMMIARHIVGPENVVNIGGDRVYL